MWTKIRVFRVAFAVILIAGLPPVGCTPAGKPPVVGDQTIWNIAAGRAEVSSAVIPPGVNAACNQGRVLIVAAAGDSSPAVYAGDLSKSGIIQNITPQDSA